MKKRVDIILIALLTVIAALVLGFEVSKREKSNKIPLAKEIETLKVLKKKFPEKPKNQAQKIYSLLYDLTHRKLSAEVSKKESLNFVQIRYIPLELQLCATLKDEPVVSEGAWAGLNTERFCRSLEAEEGIYDPVALEEAWVKLQKNLSDLGYVVKKEREIVSISWE